MHHVHSPHAAYDKHNQTFTQQKIKVKIKHTHYSQEINLNLTSNKKNTPICKKNNGRNTINQKLSQIICQGLDTPRPKPQLVQIK